MRGYCSYRHKEKIRTKSTLHVGVDSEGVYVVNECCSNARSQHRRKEKMKRKEKKKNRKKKKKEEEFNN